MSKSEYRTQIKESARIISHIRRWLDERELVEVFTAPVREGATNDIGIQSSRVSGRYLKGWLQSSPELAMKVLLSSGSGDIYQICPAFRDEMHSLWHKSQFLMLEWYRIGWDMKAVMDESSCFLQSLHPLPIQHIDISQHLKSHFGITPKTSGCDIIAFANQAGFESCDQVVSAYDFLIDCIIKQSSKQDHWVLCAFYPDIMPALAATKDNKAMRFEFYLNHIEVGHGYEELIDADQAKKRFDRWHQERIDQGLDAVDYDQKFLQALRVCPASTGVSFGIDRLITVIQGYDHIMDLL